MSNFFKKKRLEKEDDEVEAQFKKFEEEKKKLLQKPAPKEEIQPKQPNKFKKVRTANAIILARKGIHFSMRHYMPELLSFMPNVQQLPKFTGEDLVQLNSLAEKNNCEVIMMLESKGEENTLFWIGLKDQGPTVCFKLTNPYTIEELSLFGKCSKNSSPLLIFDKAFESAPQYGIMKQILTKALSVPYKTKGMKEIVDTAISFFIVEGHIYFRKYQISWDEDQVRLFEAGPRFILQPLFIMNGPFCGRQIWRNDELISKQKPVEKKEETDDSEYDSD